MPKDFLNEIHVIQKHQPFNNTNSAFKATLNPSGGYLNIELKVKYVFSAAWRLCHPSMSKSTFKKKVADMVDNVWSGRYAISIQGDTDDRKVSVQTNVSMIEADDDSHFTINVQRMGSGRSWVDTGKCKFYSGAVNYKPSALAMKIGYRVTFGEWSHDRVIYRDAEKYTKNEIERKVWFAKNSLEPKISTIAKEIADGMKEYADVWPLLPLRLTGYRLHDEGLHFSQRRAEEFREKLKQAGAPNSPIEIIDGGVETEEASPYVKVEVVSARSAFLDRVNNFPIAAHEVGHMLGLEDEYELDSYASSINNYASRANVSVPPFSQNTSSLMSQGDKFLPYHYITFHETINTMAKNFCKANSDGRNGNPTITIQKSLLRKSDPKVLDTIDISGLFS